MIWTPAQRRALLCLVGVLAASLVWRGIVHREYVSEPQPLEGARARELADRIDPNVATAAELAVLPQLGEKRAVEIVAFRERLTNDRPGAVVFSCAEDLLQIRGIGAAMVEILRPYLMFPKLRATTQTTSPS